ncbi:MAG: phytanoyl-CoA dioxygenase [Geitlerinemataceae cyanobacterium]
MLREKIKRKVYEASSDIVYLSDRVKYARTLPELSFSDRRIVKGLRDEGVAITSLDDLGVPDTDAFLNAANALNRQLDQQMGDRSQLSTNERHAFSHAIPIDAVTIARDWPELFLWGVHDRILDIMERYIGMPASCHGVNMRRDVTNGKQIGTRCWHIDGEDRTVVKVIIYMSDVEGDCGPFEYIPYALTPSYKKFKHVNYQIDNAEMEKVIPRSQWKQCTGKKGTVIFTDTGKIFHHGSMPEQERTAIFFAYTSNRPKRPEMCESSSFRKGLDHLSVPLTARQKRSIWHYRDR